MDSDAEALTNLRNSLKYLHKLKVSLHSLFESLANGPSEGQENNAYLRGLQQRLLTMDNAFTDLENSGNMLPTSNPAPSTNTMSIPLEPEDENYEIFRQLTNCYTWNRRVQEYSTSVHSFLKENQLKRTAPSTGSLAKRARKASLDTHNMQTTSVDKVILQLNQSLNQKHPETSIQIYRPMGMSTVLLVTIGKIMKVIMVFRGLHTERIIVKGYGEAAQHENGQVDMWSESKYKVFQLVTHCAQAAILHFHSAVFPEMALYSLVQWLHTYTNLFSDCCNYCQRILNNNLPPTGRGFEKVPIRYHPQCASSQAR
ncbi:mediator of RNA polymerase II transcription subunit 27-like [Watersipora subatra]|uniref:mediator of RNA polymerase II transcription subunit 27-like n=1 Tax=Watersipora subatra TaxID=2589382 RepID=UPI00355B66FA